jgi:7,8-dihydropterin-6-yl-methyl-4-(beta-D-ribofuranosyl)aminobenzene 5'-phosphate synthase
MSVQKKFITRLFFVGIAVFCVIGMYCLASDVHEAAKQGDLAKLKTLIAENPDLANAKNENQETPLHAAVSGGHLDIVDLLIAAKADVNAVDNQKRTPLHLACYDGHEEIAEKLISHGADLEAKFSNGTTPLFWAIPEGHTEVFELLVNRGADINAKTNDGANLLHTTALYGQKNMAEILIGKGADVNRTSDDGTPPINYAAARGHREVLELLIDKGADVNAADDRGYTPLRISILLGQTEIVETLLARGADPNRKNDDGATPLHDAATEGHAAPAELLIAHEAEVNAEDAEGHTPLHLAANHGYKDIVDLLVAKGADVNVQDGGGDTALHGAAWKGDKEIVELLIVHRARISAKNNSGRIPLDNALRQGHTEISDLLMAKGGSGMEDSAKRERKILAGKINQRGIQTPLKFTILYDNYLHKEGTKPDWGFSCLIEGAEKTILFDTGTNPEILMHNVEQLEVDLEKVEQIVISHEHYDHTGGLNGVLEKNHEVSVYLPVSFPYEFVRNVETRNAEVVSIDEPFEICQNVYSTGEMGDQIKEQSLILNTDKGLVIVTGCSHQGIVAILKRAMELFDRPIHLVFGGFHLGAKSKAELEEIIRNFKEIGVERCGATHCTGDEAIGMFKKAFGENYVPMGTGKVFEVNKK